MITVFNFKKISVAVFMLLFLLLAYINAFAVGPVTFTLTQQLPRIMNINSPQTTSYTLKNNTTFNISNIKIVPYVKNGTYIITGNTCNTTLAPQAQCAWTGEVTINSLDCGYADAIVKVFYVGNSTTLKQTIKTNPNPGPGRFQYQDSEGSVINSQLNLRANETGEIRVYNVGDTAITNFVVGLPSITGLTFTTNNCSSITTLPSSDYCSLDYQVGATPANDSGDVVSTGNNVDNNPDNLNIAIRNVGHFQYQDGEGSVINSPLSLSANEVGEIRIYNTGGTAITNFTVNLPSISGLTFTTNTCTSVSTLPSSDYCSLEYEVSATPASNSGDIIAAGSNVDNSPQSLNIAIRNLGHFQYQDSMGNMIDSPLNLRANEVGEIRVYNTGGTAITDLAVNLPSISGLTFTINTCSSMRILPSNDYCLLNYEVSATPASNSGDITATGNNADNSPHSLNIATYTLGHFQYQDNMGNTIDPPLDLSANETGEIRVYNTGNTAITNVAVALPTITDLTFTDNTCNSITTLSSGDYCLLKYSVGGSPTESSGNVTATGDDADNSPQNLSVATHALGYFSYRSDMVNVISSPLSLYAGNTGEIRVYNTGNTAITNVTVTLPTITDLTFTDNTCSSINTLSVGDYCVLKYSVGSAPIDLSSDIVANGDNAENAPSPLTLATKFWYVLPKPGSGKITVMRLIGNNIYLGTPDQGVFKSLNGGNSWQAINSGIGTLDIESMTIDGTDIFVGTNGQGIYKSINQGQSWTEKNQGLTNVFILSLLTYNNALYAGAQQGYIYKSSDGGDSWQQLSKVADTFIQSIIEFGGKLYAGTQEGVFEVDLNNGNFQKIGLDGINVFTVYAYDGRIYAGTENGIYRSDGNGLNWELFNTGINSSEIRAFSNNSDFIFSGGKGGNGVFKSDGTSNWSNVGTNIPGDVSAMLFSDGRLYVGTEDNGIYVTSDL